MRSDHCYKHIHKLLTSCRSKPMSVPTSLTPGERPGLGRNDHPFWNQNQSKLFAETNNRFYYVPVETKVSKTRTRQGKKYNTGVKNGGGSKKKYVRYRRPKPPTTTHDETPWKKVPIRRHRNKKKASRPVETCAKPLRTSDEREEGKRFNRTDNREKQFLGQPKAIKRKKIRTKKRPKMKFDSTLGYPGEGPVTFDVLK